jgi:DNA repair exonuclease SbcCD nuclease subunit
MSAMRGNVMKIVTITDTHIRLTTPAARTDVNWLNTILAKLRWVYSEAETAGAVAVCISGDLGDEASWSPKAIVKTQELFREFQQRGIQTICTIGQHDVYGHKIDEWKYTGLGILESSGVITVLHDGQHVTLSKDGVDCVVYGFGFNEEKTLALLDGNYTVENRKGNSLALIHASIGAEETFGWKSVKNTKIAGIKVASFGDIHQGFEPTILPTGTLCYSTGALVRSSSADIGRVPFMGVLEFRKGGVELEFIEVPCTKDTDAFKPEYFDNKTDTEGISDEFVAILKNIRETTDESAKSRIARIGKTLGYSESVIALAVNNTEETE